MIDFGVVVALGRLHHQTQSLSFYVAKDDWHCSAGDTQDAARLLHASLQLAIIKFF